MRRIVISGPQPVDMLDVAGPLEVFKLASKYEVILVSPGRSSRLELNHGLTLSDAVPYSKLAGQIDTLVIAGGPGANRGQYDANYLKWIAESASRARRVAAICTGAFVLAAAGLLDGKRAVTHWDYCGQLSQQYPSILVESDPIYLRDGSIYTSAGITAGIDLALALVEEDHGHSVALQIARMLVMFLVRPGGQSQYSHMLSRQAAASHPLRELQVWMIENLREDLGVEKLAERMRMSSRHFTRVCLRETRMNPGQFVDRLRVEAAQQLIDSSEMGLKEIADTCGFQNPLSMRRSFIRVIGITAGEYASRFKRPQSETPQKVIVKRSVTNGERRSKRQPRSMALSDGH
jgi:transcriptional regulator GlxA family with amidase domain